MENGGSDGSLTMFVDDVIADAVSVVEKTKERENEQREANCTSKGGLSLRIKRISGSSNIFRNSYFKSFSALQRLI